jgi:lipopolysaccharide export system permease protein
LRNRGLKEEALRELAIELNKKMAVPVSCLVFALIGIPLGIRAHRSVRSRGFTIGLFLVLAYYLLRISGEALVETGRLSPIIGTWTPNWIFAAAGILLFYLSAKEVSFRRLFRGISADPKPDAAAADGASQKGKGTP